jgi:hypothetical protein
VNIILSLMIILSAIFGGQTEAPAPISQPASDPASFTLAPFKLASTWVPEALADAGVAYPENVVFLYQNEYNCGAEISDLGQGGCTVTMEDGSGYVVLLSPELAYTAWGNHILFHELAHTMGADECTAEAYAHQFEAVALWSYPECAA